VEVVQIFGEIVRAGIEVPRDSDHDGIGAGGLEIPEVVVDVLGGRFDHNGADDSGGPRQRSIHRGRRGLVHLPVEQATRVAAEDGTGLVEEVNMAVDDGDGARP
jgi:hypothetical protein